MGRIQVVLDEDVEQALRSKAKVKGDISRIINETLSEKLVTVEEVKK